MTTRIYEFFRRDWPHLRNVISIQLFYEFVYILDIIKFSFIILLIFGKLFRSQTKWTNKSSFPKIQIDRGIYQFYCSRKISPRTHEKNEQRTTIRESYNDYIIWHSHHIYWLILPLLWHIIGWNYRESTTTLLINVSCVHTTTMPYRHKNLWISYIYPNYIWLNFFMRQ